VRRRDSDVPKLTLEDILTHALYCYSLAGLSVDVENMEDFKGSLVTALLGNKELLYPCLIKCNSYFVLGSCGGR
jgi:hypothetical protein